MDDLRGPLIEALRSNAAQWQAEGSPFYGALVDRIADDVEAGGPTWTVLSSHADRPETELPAIRLLDAVHRRVLSGQAPALVTHYPSTGGNGDAAAAWAPFLDVVERDGDELREALDHPVQTNAVGRCPAIVGGLLTVAATPASQYDSSSWGRAPDSSSTVTTIATRPAARRGETRLRRSASSTRGPEGCHPSVLRCKSPNDVAATNILSIPVATTTA